MVLERPAHFAVRNVASVHQRDRRDRAEAFGRGDRSGKREPGTGVNLYCRARTRTGRGLAACNGQNGSGKAAPAIGRHATGPRMQTGSVSQADFAYRHRM